MEHVIDAKNKKLGRLASEIAVILQGKKRAAYEPRLAGGDKVTVKNVRLMEVSGGKADKKVYYRHTGYMGHLKEEKYKEVFAKNPAKVLRRAVLRMLPKNKLQLRRIKNLIVAND